MISKKKMPTAKEPAKRKARGEQSRVAILQAAAQLVTLHGLKGLSIGDLAAHLGISKSGLYAHFKSKEELELATIQTALDTFEREVIKPALTQPAGLTRLYALVDEFLGHLRRGVFPGGCFFAAAAAELAPRPGLAHDRVKQIMVGWLGLLEQCIRDAQSQNEVDLKTDAKQLAFETEAMLLSANLFFVMSGEEERLAQARRGIEKLFKKLV